jgi:Fungal specific transcription factor domain
VEPGVKALSNPKCWLSGAACPEGVLEDGVEGDGPQPVKLNDIKTAFLTSIYEYTHLPGRKAWTRMGVLARMAYSCGLHQVDSPSNSVQMSDGEREERRYVWWAIWKLDTYSNCIASTPFLFDQDNICTFLVSTSVDDFTAGNIMPSTRTLLAAGPGPLTRMFEHLKFTDASYGQKIYIIVNCLLREVSTVRRQLVLNATPTVCDRFATLKNTCSYIRLALPTWYLHPVRKISPAEEPNTHRLRLEILLQLQTLVFCFLSSRSD